MRSIFTYLIAGFLLIGASSNITLAQYITPEQTSTSVGPTAGSVSVNVDSDVEWTASESADWITSAENNGSGQLVITYQENASETDRSADVTLTYETTSATVTINQNGIELNVNPTDQNVTSSAGSFQIDVTSNFDWSYNSNAEWLVLTNSSNQITVGFGENTSLLPRAGTITVTAGSVNQTVTVEQAGAAAVLTVSPSNRDVTSASGTTSFTVTSNFSAWQADENVNWLTAEKDGNQVNVTYEANNSTSERQGTVTISGEGITREVTVTQAGAAGYITPGQTTVNVGSEDSQTSVNVSSNVNWTASESITWLTASRNGNNLNIDYQANTSTEDRSGAITLTDGSISATVTVNQAGSSPSLTVSPSNRDVTSSSGTTSFSVTSNFSTWQADENVNWLTVEKSGSNVNVDYEANSSISSRTGTITVSGEGITREVTVTQAGTSPSLAVSPSNRDVASSSGSTSFSVTSNFSTWTVSDNAEWLTVEKSGNNVNVDYEANSSISSRTGTITVSGEGITREVTVTQAGAAGYITPAQTTVNVGSGNSQTSISVSSNVNWTVSENITWIDASRNGSNLSIDYDANPSTDDRSGVITLTDGNISSTVTVNQSGANPSLSISPTSETAAKGGETIVFTVNSNITWTASDNADWVTLNISGNQISAVAAANNTVNSRTATITVSGNGVSPVTATINQSAGDAYITPSQASVNVGSGSGQTSVSISSNVNWTVSENTSWITAAKSGNSLNINYDANPGTSGRNGAITLNSSEGATATVTLNQAGADPSLSVTPLTANASKGGETIVFNVTSNIIWNAEETADWINLTKTATQISAVVAANNTVNERSANITVSGEGVSSVTLKITQAAGDASLTVDPASRSVTYAAGNTEFTVTANVEWSVNDNADWLTAGRNGNTINVNYDLNNNTTSRSATITVTGGGATKQVTVTQAGAPAYISPDETAVNVGNAAGNYSINIASNVTWSVSDNANWLSASKDGTQINIAYDVNNTVEQRTGTITLSNSAQGVSASITVTQAAGLPFIDPASEQVNINSYTGGNSTVNISANVPWTASENSDWFNITSNSTSINITYSENMTISSRSGNITITGSGITKSISVSQIAGPERLSVTPSSQTLEYTEGDASFTVSANVPWTISENLTWLLTTKETDKFTAVVVENTSADSRSGNITIKGTSLTKTVSVTQNGAPAVINAEPENKEVAYNSGSESFTVTGNFSNWSVSDDADWLMAMKSGSQVNVNYQENKTVSARIGRIIVSGRGTSDTVTITQQAGLSNLNVTPLNRNVSYTAGETSFTVTSNTAWDVNEDVAWLSTVKSESQITVSFTENPSTAGRTGSLVLSGGGITHTLTVKQDGRPEQITLTPAGIEVTDAAGTTSFDVSTNTDSWNAAENVSWLAVSIAGPKVNISYEKNTSVSSRSGKVTITAGDSSKAFTINQKGTPAAISSEPSSATVSFEEGTTNFNISSNVEWEISENLDWLTALKLGSAIQVNYVKNNLREQRTGIITITGGGYTLNINITQGGNVEVDKPALISPANSLYLSGISLLFNWNRSALADNYTLEISDSSQFTNIIYSYPGLVDNSYVVSNLKEGMKYFWRVKASNSYGYYNYSDIWNFTSKLLQPGNLRVSQNAFNEVILSWQDNSKNETGYDILRKSSGGEFSKLTTVPSGQVNYIDASIKTSGSYTYRVYAYSPISISDTSEVSITITIIAVEDDPLAGIPADYSLSGAYPNPFNPSAKIKYGLPEESSVVIEVFNILGEKVETLLNEPMKAGYHEARWNAYNMPSGIYIIRAYAKSLSSDREFVSVKKAMLLK